MLLFSFFFFVVVPHILQIVLWRGKVSSVGRAPDETLEIIGSSPILNSSGKWIDAGGNPVVRHEGVPPSNNLIKDGTHRATVFVGPTLKSFSFYFRQIFYHLYGGDTYENKKNY